MNRQRILLKLVVVVVAATFLPASSCNEELNDGETTVVPVTVDVSADLQEMLEVPKVRGACKIYFAKLEKKELVSHEERLLCGKEMFFYEPFGTASIPRSIIEFMGNELPDSVGLGYTKLGMVDDRTMTRGCRSGSPPVSRSPRLKRPQRSGSRAPPATSAACPTVATPRVMPITTTKRPP